MCRASDEGGRRCTDHNAFGMTLRSLQAKKQYHAGKGNAAVVQEMTRKMQELREQKQALLADGGTVTPYNMPLTPAAERVLDQLRADGYEPYVVGGSVRDALLGLESKDVDIEVYKATPNQVVRSLRKIGQVDEVGKSFGVLKIRIGEEDFDVSLPRKDSKVGDGHRGFTVELTPDLSLTEATARRDYTINALMYDNKLGYIVDKHGGLEDLKAGHLRHISDAFDEDPLRVIRGVQFASRFDMQLHPDTVVKAQTLQPQFKDLAKERIQTEFQKLYEKGKSPHKAFQLLQETGWDKSFTGLHEANTVDLHTDLKRVQDLTDTGVLPKNKAALILSANIATHLSDRDARNFLSYTTVGDDLKNASFNLSRVSAPETESNATLRSWTRTLPRTLTAHDWVLLAKAKGETETAAYIEKRVTELGILDSYEPDMVNGDDMLTHFTDRKPGKWMKEALDSVRAAQYSDQFRTRETGLAWMKTNTK